MLTARAVDYREQMCHSTWKETLLLLGFGALKTIN